MGELVFVGLGLFDEFGISLRGLEEVKTADAVFAEFYTSLMPNFSFARFREISGKGFIVLSRRHLEEENGKIILEAAVNGKAVLLVPGDPLVATTHLALRIKAEKLGIKTRLIHGASIISAVVGLSGLHSYKFGKSVTIPFSEETPAETPYRVIEENKSRGLHTLCLLDIKVEEKRYLKIGEGLKSLLDVEAKNKRGIVTTETLAIGIAQAGSKEPIVKADFVKKLLNHDFGDPPHSLIFLGSLHFMEAEALITLSGAPEKIREMVE